MSITTSTKEFTLVNNAIPSHDIAFDTYYATRWFPMFTENMITFLKTRHIPFLFLIVSFHVSSKFSQQSIRRCWTIVIENDSINNKKWYKIQIEMF